MITLAVEQGSEAWIQARLGIPTASNFRRIITASGVLSRSSVGYMNELLTEWQSGTRQVIYTSKWMQRGIEMEAEARSSYALRTNTKVAQVGLVYRDKNRLIAASPDGLVNQDGLLEIKCPQPARHETYLYHGKVPTIYIPQVQGQLWVTKRKWCDFFSYHPDFANQLLVRVTRDECYIDKLRLAVESFVSSMLKKRLRY